MIELEKPKINRVEVGIIFAPTNKWTTYKYDLSGVKSNLKSK